VLLSIIIPFRNEEDNAKTTVKTVHQYFLDEKIDFEVIAIDDSIDKTYSILLELASELGNFKVIRGVSSLGRGYGVALKLGIIEAKGDVVIPMNADLCDSLPDSIRMFQLIQAGADVVVASRFMPDSVITGVRPLKRYISYVGNVFLSVLFGIRMTDITNSYKAYRKKVVEEVNPVNIGFSFTLELFLGALNNGCQYEQMPTAYQERQSGESKMVIGKTIQEYLQVALRFFFKSIKRKITVEE